MIKRNLLIFILFFSFSISSQNLTTFGPYIKDDNSNNLIFCMGTIAELYKNMGGDVFILGKPSVEIYFSFL